MTGLELMLIVSQDDGDDSSAKNYADQSYVMPIEKDISDISNITGIIVNDYSTGNFNKYVLLDKLKDVTERYETLYQNHIKTAKLLAQYRRHNNRLVRQCKYLQEINELPE